MASQNSVEVLGQWVVRVVENGNVQCRSFDIERFAFEFAEAQRKRLNLDKSRPERST